MGKTVNLQEIKKTKKKLGIVEEKNRYVKNTLDQNREIETEVLSEFIVIPKELIRCEKESEILVDIIYKNKSYETTMFAENFSNSSSFREVIGKVVSPMVWYSAERKDHQKVLRIIDQYEKKEVEGVKNSGFIKKGKEWNYVTSKGVLKPNEVVSDNIRILKNYKQLENADILNSELLTDTESRELKECVFNFNDSKFTSSFLGCISSIFLKERLWDLKGIKFPTMCVIGMAGSGKSATVENIGLPILNMDITSQVACNQFTNFTAIKNSSSSNTAPFILNEYKPNELNKWTVEGINNFINSTYDRLTGQRGKSDQSIVEYPFKAPMILVGESYEPDQSKVERIINLHMNKEESKQYTEGFEILKSKEVLLNKLGKTLLLKCLNITDEEILNLWNKNVEYMKNKGINSTRCNDNLSVTLTGIDILMDALKETNEININKKKNDIVKRFKDDTMDGNNDTKKAVHRILEDINQLVYNGNFARNREYKIDEVENIIALDMVTIFERLMKRKKDLGEELELTKNSFSKMLKKEPYFIENNKNVRFDVKVRKCFILNYEKLKELNQKGIEMTELLDIAGKEED